MPILNAYSEKMDLPTLRVQTWVRFQNYPLLWCTNAIENTPPKTVHLEHRKGHRISNTK